MIHIWTADIHFTFMYIRSSYMNHFIYITSFHSFHGSELWAHNCELTIDLAPNVWLHSSVGRASHRYRGGHGFESRWSPDFFQASLFQLLKLEIHCEDHISPSCISAVHIWIISYTLHHFTPFTGKYELTIDLAPNVWLHSSVGRASHRYRGGHGFESRWSPDFFQASLFQLLKLEIHCEDHISPSCISAVHIWIISYTLHHFTPFTGKYELTIDLAPNVWLHSSVGRASHRYRGGHGFESRWSPDFFSGFFIPIA